MWSYTICKTELWDIALFFQIWFLRGWNACRRGPTAAFGYWYSIFGKIPLQLTIIKCINNMILLCWRRCLIFKMLVHAYAANVWNEKSEVDRKQRIRKVINTAWSRVKLSDVTFLFPFYHRLSYLTMTRIQSDYKFLKGNSSIIIIRTFYMKK